MNNNCKPKNMIRKPVDKSDKYTYSLGLVDQATSFIGMSKYRLMENDFAYNFLHSCQIKMFSIGDGISDKSDKITKEDIEDIQNVISSLESFVEDKDFVLSDKMAHLDVCRSAVRMLEISIYQLDVVLLANTLDYLNRLSKALWLFARYLEGGSLHLDKKNSERVFYGFNS